MCLAILKKIFPSMLLTTLIFNLSWSTDRIYPSSEYQTLENAIAAAVDGDCIIMNMGFDGTFTINQNNLTIWVNGNGIYLSAPIQVYGANLLICAANIFVGNNLSAFQTYSHSDLKLFYCNIIGQYNGSSIYGIDDYGADNLECFFSNFYNFSSSIDALNNWHIYVAESHLESTNRNLNIRTYYGDFLSMSFLQGFFVNTNGDGIYVNKPNGDLYLSVKNNSLYTYNSGYPLVARGSGVSIIMDYNKFQTCPNNSYSLLNGAEFYDSPIGNEYGSSCNP